MNGLTYNVSFLDGTCISVFDGCDESSDFAFNSDADANSTSVALMEQVFNSVDTYDKDPELTRGLTHLGAGDILTPYAFYSTSVVYYSGMTNRASILTDLTFCGVLDASCTFGITFDLSSSSSRTWAKWSQVSAVPVPAAIWLFGTALIGLVGFGKRRKAA